MRPPTLAGTVKRPLTMAEERLLDACAGLRMIPGTNRKRFVRQMVEARSRHMRTYTVSIESDGTERLIEDSPEPFMMTDKQIASLARIAWRFRKQLPTEIVILAAMMGGSEPSPYQKECIASNQAKMDRARYVEGSAQGELGL